MESVTYGKHTVYFDLRFSKRKTLGIAVYPDMNVVVTAPKHASRKRIFETVKSKARWILKQRRHFEKYQPISKPKAFVSGESHLYLGRQYLLKIQKGDSNKVTLKGRHLIVETRDQDSARDLVMEWYRAKARVHFSNIIDELLPEFERKDLTVRELVIRKMKTRWGSCTPNGVITLNLYLIKAPRRCIEYVILHELCHLIHHRHDAEFYMLLHSMMPGWKKWKEKLEITLA